MQINSFSHSCIASMNATIIKIAFSLMLTLAVSLFLSTYLHTPFFIYISALCTFHLLEFACTAPFTERVSANGNNKLHTAILDYFTAFLINHSREYHASIVAAIIEYVVEYAFFHHLIQHGQTLATLVRSFGKVLLCTFNYHLSFLKGIICMVFGQGWRSWAMIHAGANFSHLVSRTKKPSHKLITSGPYW